jgi:hypothetical protein
LSTAEITIYFSLFSTFGLYREAYVTELVTSEMERLRNRDKHDVQLFTYSIGETEVEVFPKALACAVGGVWSRLVDDDDIFDALTSYYQLFTLGLGAGPNKDFTAWVEPYVYATGGVLGTTVSAPVYDRTISPPLFLGVVGIDFPLEALDRALGVTSGSAATLDQVVKKSSAKCPTWNLTLCELESFRRRGVSSDQALCTRACGIDDFVGIEQKQCAAIDDVPQVLWADRSFEGIDYKKRVCCKEGDTAPSDQCSAGSGLDMGLGAIVGLILASVFVLTVGTCIAWKVFTKGRPKLGAPSKLVALRDVRAMDPPPVNVSSTRFPAPVAPPETSG